MKGYHTGHVHSLTVMEAFCTGAGIPLLDASGGLQAGGAAMYGNARTCQPVLAAAIKGGREWVYIDRGYFGATVGNDYSGYFRATRGAFMHDGAGAAKPDRWNRLGKLIMPWKRNGDHVLVCPPGPVYASLRGFDAAKWLEDTLATLKQSTDRELRVRAKPGKGVPPEPLSQALRGCHALVTHSSNAAVDALIAGVPVFPTAKCSASRMGIADVRRIEMPYYPDDREQFCWNLAQNQWLLSEMRSGECWRYLQASQ